MQYAFGYFTEISKYVIIAVLAGFTLLSAIMFLTGSRKAQKVLGFIQCIMIFIMQALCFLHLTIAGKNEDYIFLYLFSQLLLIAVMGLVHLLYEGGNIILLNNMCMLLGIGFCMISRLDFHKAIRQIVIVAISFAVSIFIPAMIKNFHFWRKLTWGYGVIGVGVLSAVLLLGEMYGGSKISYTIANTITFQPSEFVKILFLFFLAGILWEDHGFFNVFISAFVAGLHVIILVISTDLGSALIFFVAYVLVVFVCTRNYLYLALGIGGGAGAAYVAYQLFDHVRIRVLAWQDPWKYIDNKGYQITQSLFAVGSGNWFGMGLFGGNPKAIPLVDRDFIFSSVCEEMGVISGIAVIIICLISYLTMVEIAVKVKDHFYQLIVYGISTVYLFQLFLTVGGGIKFIPMTGVTLPFVSYGGSSAMSMMFMFFIVQGIYLMLLEKGGAEDESPRESGRSARRAGSGIHQSVGLEDDKNAEFGYDFEEYVEADESYIGEESDYESEPEDFENGFDKETGAQ